jgi:hypothetical protein
MDFEYVKTCYEILVGELELFGQVETAPVKKLGSSINAVRLSLDALKAKILEDDFPSQPDEIYFFKKEKPKFLCEQLYALEIFTIETNRPLAGEEQVKAFYEQELKYIKRFFEQYRFLYQYYQLDAHEMDHLFFVRGVRPADILLPDVQDFDPAFATAADYLFAKFMACEKVQDYLLQGIYGATDNRLPFSLGKNANPLKWVGSKSDLVELAYGIFGTMQINNGEAGIADIIFWLEQSLNIDLGRYYQTFSEIKARKSISKTHYLDHMKEMLTRHIEEGDAFKPRKIKKVPGYK